MPTDRQALTADQMQTGLVIIAQARDRAEARVRVLEEALRDLLMPSACSCPLFGVCERCAQRIRKARAALTPEKEPSDEQ